MRWNHQTILDEIRHLHTCGEELCFFYAETTHPHVVRAALWHFGSWKIAVEAAGLDPQLTSKYRRWTREDVVAAIRAHHRDGHDLSWRAFSTAVDPPLAAAARRAGTGFDSWKKALEAAGINPQKVAKYRRWTRESVLDELLLVALERHDFAAAAMQRDHPALYCAAIRRFDSWAEALTLAGIGHRQVEHRQVEGRLTTAPEAGPSSEVALCAASHLPPENADPFKPSSEFDAREMSARIVRMAAKPDLLSDGLTEGSGVSREFQSSE